SSIAATYCIQRCWPTVPAARIPPWEGSPPMDSSRPPSNTTPAHASCADDASLSYSSAQGDRPHDTDQVGTNKMAELPNTRSGWLDLLRAVRRAVGGADGAEDLLHSAFVRLSEYSARESVDNPSGFLVRTAANLAVDERRRVQVRRESPIDIGEMLSLSDG